MKIKPLVEQVEKELKIIISHTKHAMETIRNETKVKIFISN